ncbi:MAG TPA: polyphosphate kinase 1 [Leptospiraceae bacterium]|nr:polyphosphate kinase 1 [Leptospiraceae bacterium]HMW04115.1 polyphosphate kinase 1 [Leptospiraceae bacterium]HMX30818.1 polyphosphate kinase 1 [Leptospiraceae bacterium]HMY30108.1 polyphosphate kinase 1 [Leptospiraceae bacterium]HMZ65454.1 polyphosphate kinase 1 [Leptospiraceae bacterium]
MDRTELLNNKDIFFDRELSWLDFNFRVLDEAADTSIPVLERLKFLCITESNLDEFFMVRVAGLRDQVNSGIDDKSLNGMRNSEVILEISKKVKIFIREQYKILVDQIIPSLKANKIHIITNEADLKPTEISFIKKYYKEEVSSILTPLAIDPSHPFPHLLNRSLNLAITLTGDEDNNRNLFAIVQVPSLLPRFLELPSSNGDRRFFPLEGIITLHLSDLFYGLTVKEIHAFRIMRDSDLSIHEEVEGSLLTNVKKELKNRFWGDAVRLDVHSKIPETLKHIVMELLKIQDHEMYEIPGFLNMGDLMYFYNLSHTSNLKFSPIPAKNKLGEYSLDKIFQLIRKNDIILHHPYDSFQAVEDLLKFASEDPKVLAIKMTLYRTSGDSPIIQYLKQAAENGKQVTVLVELKARFDEERNIIWAQRLEDSGVHVVYGIIGLKIHCKVLLIIRRETDKLKRYVHLSTGNYNSTTARFYTDLSLFTNNINITEDIGTLFNALTSSAKMPKLSTISAAPNYLRDDILGLINQEIENAKQGKPAHIFLKMNSLVDGDLILALYEASSVGIKVDLVIRGICCLRPGVPGVSENIIVRSIVGRFLEHSRIFLFHNAGKPKLFLSSADCMPRNFFKRIEVMFPILDEKVQQKIFKIIEIILKDNVKARILGSDGIYRKLSPVEGEIPIDSQMELAKI